MAQDPSSDVSHRLIDQAIAWGPLWTLIFVQLGVIVLILWATWKWLIKQQALNLQTVGILQAIRTKLGG